MTLFKKKNKNRPAVLYTIDMKFKEARENHQNCFYYALTNNEVDLVRAYCLTRYHAVVEVDHKNDNIIVYKFYGYTY